MTINVIVKLFAVYVSHFSMQVWYTVKFECQKTCSTCETTHGTRSPLESSVLSPNTSLRYHWRKNRNIISPAFNESYNHINGLIWHFCSSSPPVVSFRPQFHCCCRIQIYCKEGGKHILIIIWISHKIVVNISTFYWHHACCHNPLLSIIPLNLLKCTCHVMYFSHSFQSAES